MRVVCEGGVGGWCVRVRVSIYNAQFTAVAVYLPPANCLPDPAQLESILQTFARDFIPELQHGVVVLGGDFNSDLRGGSTVQGLKARKAIWDRVWTGAQEEHVPGGWGRGGGHRRAVLWTGQPARLLHFAGYMRGGACGVQGRMEQHRVDP